ncbi:MAG TPA: hypothetical protein VM124_02785 [Candidatus Limnocylindrales bacterium]|nr:hypothetical protein [Candidatus Limnocylindrales bacterium]
MKSPDNTLLVPTELLIMGFSYARSFVGCGAFSLRQLAIVSANEGYPIDISNLYTPAGELAVRGFLQDEVAASHDHGHDFPFRGRGYSFLEPGFDPLIATVMRGVRKSEKTLPDLLRLSVSVKAIDKQGQFFKRLRAQLLDQPSSVI